MRIVSESVWVAEYRGRTAHRFEVFLPHLLDNPARTAWWASAALSGMAHLDEAGWLRGTKRWPYRIDYDARTTPWSVLAFYIPPIGSAGHWPCLRRLSRLVVPMLLKLQKQLARFDAPADHACFETSTFFCAHRHLGRRGMATMQ